MTASQATKTSDDTEETGITTTSGSKASAVPDMGLGKESVSSGTATADSSEPTETKDSSAPSGPLSQARFTFIFCITINANRNIGWTELLSDGTKVNQQLGEDQSVLERTIIAHSQTTVPKVLVNAP
ncbi:Nicotinamide riboside kinase [Fusarium oxysporum f. sp. albedinis]|nr:Nicotinamide riboside kinase [Fusarium oxysporum f. sp. albedinis]